MERRLTVDSLNHHEWLSVNLGFIFQLLTMEALFGVNQAVVWATARTRIMFTGTVSALEGREE